MSESITFHYKDGRRTTFTRPDPGGWTNEQITQIAIAHDGATSTVYTRSDENVPPPKVVTGVSQEPKRVALLEHGLCGHRTWVAEWELAAMPDAGDEPQDLRRKDGERVFCEGCRHEPFTWYVRGHGQVVASTS